MAATDCRYENYKIISFPEIYDLYCMNIKMANSHLSQNQTQGTGFELSYGTCWDLKPWLVLLYLHYVVHASSIKRPHLIYGHLNLLSDTLDYRKFFAFPSTKFYYFSYVFVL
jgi:hypothetical protein